DNIALWLANELSLTHNVIIRALNSIWLNAPLVLREDEADFVQYNLTCLEMIRSHHEAQEMVIFPRLQEKIDMRKNVVQHLEFDAALKNFKAYLVKVHDRVEPYDSERVLELRKALGSRLVQHLHDEISTVSTKRLSVFTNQELNEILNALEEHNRGLRESTTHFPFVMTHHNQEDARNWPVVPTSVKWVGNHVGFHLHRSYWKFSPYTMGGDFQTYPPRHQHGFF
ncbi:hypothetical protein BDZ97DRAFT_1814499, partial [Flammula alnicola]